MKQYPSINEMISAQSGEFESENKFGKIMEVIEQLTSEDEELSIFEKMKLLAGIFEEISNKRDEIELILNENESFAKEVEEARLKMSGDEVHEGDYFFSRHLIDNNAAKIHSLEKYQTSHEDVDSILNLLKEWDKNSSKMFAIFGDFIEKHKDLTVINHNIKGLKEDIANTETEEDEEEQFEGMFKLTGKQFKKILQNSVVDNISGYILNVTDKTLQVRACQPIELNNLNKIRPPVSVIQDDTVIYIDEISFYNDNTGRSFDESDLETIIAFM